MEIIHAMCSKVLYLLGQFRLCSPGQEAITKG